MPHILAQVPASTPTQIAATLIAIAALLAIVKMGLDLWKQHGREQPTPYTTYQLKGDYVTRIEVQSMRSEISGQLRNLEVHIEKVDDGVRAAVATMARDLQETTADIKSDGNDRTNRTHERIDTILAAVSKLEGRIEGGHKHG